MPKITRKQWANFHAVNAPPNVVLPDSINQKPYEISGKKRGSPEQDLQILCCDYLRKAKPQLLFFSVPNHIYMGDTRDEATEGKQAHYMAKQRRMGLTPGVSDLVIVGRSKHGASITCFAELKAPKGVTSPSQDSFMEKANNVGAYTSVVRSLEDLQALLSTAGF